jgi:potassium efflux system protein
MNLSLFSLLPFQAGLRRQILSALFVTTSLIGTAVPARGDEEVVNASEGESQPSTSEVVSKPQTATQPVLSQESSTERITLEQIDEALTRYPGPGPDQSASREHKALVDARTALQKEQTWLSQRSQLESILGGAEAQLEGFAAALESAANPSYPELPNDLDLLEQLLAQRRRELTDAKSRLELLGKELAGLPENRLRGVSRTNELEALLRDLDAESSTTEVDTLLQRARQQNAEAELAWVKLSVSSTDSLRSLITSEQELLRAQITNLEIRVAAVTEQTAEQRRLDLEAQEEKANRAMRMAALQDPALQQLAEENQSWLNERRGIEAERAEMEARVKLYESEAERIRNALESIERRLGIARNSPAIGALIQREKMRMPDMRAVARTRARVNRSMRNRQIQILELELVRSELVNRSPDPVSDPGDVNSSIYREVEAELLAQRLQIIDDLTTDSNRYFDVLVSMDTAIQAVSMSVEAFEEFALAESVWIPSQTVIKGRDLFLIPGMMGEVSRETPGLFEESVFRSRHRLWISLASIVVLASAIRLLRKRANTAMSVPLVDTRFFNLIGPLFYEVMVAALPAVSMLGIAWILEAPNLENIMAFPLGNALERLFVPVLFGVLLVRLCKANGIGRSLFGWSTAACDLIQRAFYRFTFPAYGLVLLSGVLRDYGLITGQRTGSRYVTLVGLALIIFALHNIFHAQRGILVGRKRRGPLGSTAIRQIIHIGLIAWATCFGVLIVTGYFVAVQAFFMRTIQTLWLVVVIAIVGSFFRRLSRAERLRALLAWRNARREEPGSVREGMGLNWREIRDQSRDFGRIVGTFGFIIGFGWIWADTMPAMRHFGTNPLIGSGDSVLLTVGQGIRLLVCIVATTVLAIHLPRILQVLVFNRFKGITQGNRYALSTLLSYFVIVVGILWGSVIVGIRWESIQWLVAAATVGLGFGLQEIFGNLFAGIILLFERPIRVGDVVSIGTTTGTVSRIRIRSTTIRQWDRRELIVPNKDIITGQVVNWTLSDAMTRITLEIRVSRDSDTDKVSRILTEILLAQPNLLEDPEPRVFLKQLDDSSIQYTCFAYLDGLGDRLSTSGILYEKVLKRFRAEGIEIPYPQRDIHIRQGDLPDGPPA